MPPGLPEIPKRHVVFELTVANHPGVMSHICGLFSRRAYNMDGILCLPLSGGDQSRIWLKVDAEQRLDQIVCQLEKLGDVKSVVRHGADHAVFVRLAEYFQE